MAFELTAEKSGKIIYKVGSVVNFVTISSICRVTQSIIKSGKDTTLLKLTFTIFQKSKFVSAFESIETSSEFIQEESPPHQIDISGHASRFNHQFWTDVLFNMVFA